MDWYKDRINKNYLNYQECPENQMQKLLITLLFISFISIPFVSAHPFTEETIPNLTSNAPVGTTEVIVFFSEPVDINFSELKVFDANGDQIDNKDTKYHEGELSLIVTTPPLEDGVFTVSTKVLSKVDGHLVPDAFLFAIGNVVIDPSLFDKEKPSELIYLPEAGARFPGLVGQTIVLGAVIASLIIWGTQNKQSTMKEKLGQDIFESWLKKIELIEEFNNYVLISVSTRFIRDWITSRYLDQILQIIKEYRKNIIRIEFVIEDKNNKQSKSFKNDLEKNNENFIKDNVSFIKDSFLQYNRIDPNKNFDNFITGPSNKLAFEASKKVSQDVSHYNPLYLYGGVGMGKTHLLNSIGLSLKEKNKVLFISAERFMYQFVKSIKSNEMVKFKEYFRNTDILLIDDIQFMNGKEAMQEEFFHTFNALIEKGSQIIVSADRPPNKLTRIQERIKSRFSGGLVVDIQNPDYELRYKIIKSKTDELELFYSNQININKEIQEFISNEIRTSIRELVGALNRIVSFSRIYNKVPSLSEVRVILKDLLNFSENKVTIDFIQTVVCKFFKISKNEMLSPRRSRYLVRPRQAAIYLSKMLTSKSLPEIGRAFSNRDHTTVIHSVKIIDKLRKEDNELNINIDSLKNKILYNQENEI